MCVCDGVFAILTMSCVSQTIVCTRPVTVCYMAAFANQDETKKNHDALMAVPTTHRIKLRLRPRDEILGNCILCTELFFSLFCFANPCLITAAALAAASLCIAGKLPPLSISAKALSDKLADLFEYEACGNPMVAGALAPLLLDKGVVTIEKVSSYTPGQGAYTVRFSFPLPIL